MKKIILISLGIFMACNPSRKTVAQEKIAEVERKKGSEAYAPGITEEELKEHLYIYASDEFEGRETGQPGQKKAIAYLKEQYETMGISAAKTDGDYFQKVPLEFGTVPEGSLTINDEGFVIGEHVLSFSEAIGDYAEVMYLGYGIEEENYNDYEGLDVSGKLLLMKSGEPKNQDGTYVISGTYEASIWSNMSESIGKRSELAAAKGAKGILYYDDQNYPRYKQFYDASKRSNRPRMRLAAESADAPIFVLLDQTAALKLMPKIGSINTPSTITTGISINIVNKNNVVDSENVVAIIKGKSKPNEYLVISSHLDHIGVNANGEINNGADDDGSGTVALLEIAEAFRDAEKQGDGPDRSIVFLHVTGEEKGLLGSKYYTDYDPIFPLSNTVANLNIDMIGRIDPKREGDRNYVYLIGSDKLSTELHELSEAVNEKHMQIELDYTYNDDNDPNRFYYRSDHYNFAKNNIPIIFYFNGTHEDYHRPGDTPDKINYDLLRNRAQLVFHTAWEVANREERLKVDKAVN